MDAWGEEILGLSGAHRTGKTTLAQAYAMCHEIPFVRTSATEVFLALGKDPAADYPIEERLAIQEAILYAFERQYAEACKRSSFWISDRTPIDLASYMLADISRATLPPDGAVAGLVQDYVNRCLEATNSWFSVVVLVQPGIPLVAAPGKAPTCEAYIRHLNALQKGLLLEPEVGVKHFLIPKRIIDLDERIKCLDIAMATAVDSAKGLTERLKSVDLLN